MPRCLSQFATRVPCTLDVTCRDSPQSSFQSSPAGRDHQRFRRTMPSIANRTSDQVAPAPYQPINAGRDAGATKSVHCCAPAWPRLRRNRRTRRRTSESFVERKNRWNLPRPFCVLIVSSCGNSTYAHRSQFWRVDLSPQLEMLKGTLDLMVLQTLQAMGALHGYGIARRIEQISRDAILLNQGTIYASLVRLAAAGTDQIRVGNFETPTGRLSFTRLRRAERSDWRRQRRIGSSFRR